MTTYTRNTLSGSLAPINNELEKIEVSLREKLDRNPSVAQSNEMLDDLDMNSNRIINYPNAVNDSDLITKGQVASLAPVQTVNGQTGNVSIPTQIQIDNGVVFDNIAEMKSSSLEIGQLVKCKRYYVLGELVEGLEFEIQATQVVDGFIDHALSNGNVAKIVELNNVKQAGASPSPIDSRLPLQAALDYDTVSLEIDDTYLTTVELVCPVPKLIFGGGALATTTNNIKILKITSSDVTVDGISFAGVSDTFVSGAMGINATGVNNNPAAPTYINNINIVNCKFTTLGEYGVLFAYCKDSKAQNNKVDTVGYGGICGISCEDIDISKNTIKNITQGSPLDAYGIFVDRLEQNTEVSNPRSFRVNITDNFIQNVTCSGNNGQGIDTHGGVDFVIKGNIVSDCQKSIFITSSNISGTAALGSFNINISDNVIKNTAQEGEGIFVGGAIVGSSVIEYTENVVVSNNVVIGGGVAGATTTGSVTIQGTKNVVITGNNISNCSPNAVYLNFNNLSFSVTGNSIKDPFDDVSGIVACIYVDGDNQQGSIKDNTFIFDDAGLGTNVALQCMRIDNQTGLDIELGRCYFSGIDATHLQFVQLASTGVSVSGFSQATGSQIVSLTNTSSVIQAVVFNRRLPSIPVITLSREGTPIPNTVAKAPILEVSSVTATGFNIIARPYDLTTFGGAGDITVNYSASI